MWHLQVYLACRCPQDSRATLDIPTAKKHSGTRGLKRYCLSTCDTYSIMEYNSTYELICDCSSRDDRDFHHKDFHHFSFIHIFCSYRRGFPAFKIEWQSPPGNYCTAPSQTIDMAQQSVKFQLC